jgi:sulfite oxidase
MSAPVCKHIGHELLRAVVRPRQSQRLWDTVNTFPPLRCHPKSFIFQAAFVRPFSQTTPKPKPTPQPTSQTRGRVRPLPVLAASTGLLTLLFTVFQPVSHESADASTATASAPVQEARDDHENAEIPRYKLAEIKEHGPKSERPWVIYEDKVYDITDWVAAHPGGEVILRAAGSSIEPYWDIFAIHKSQYVRDLLEQYCIGRVHPSDLENGRPRQDAIEDPFISDPVRDPRLRRITEKPVRRPIVNFVIACPG